LIRGGSICAADMNSNRKCVTDLQ